jgi:threonine dehydrogenase-like Zn-dependent dehydrogenase
VARLAAIAHHGVRFSRPCPERKIAVVGLGPIGMFSARIHAALGAEVVGGDLSESRVAQLESSGVRGVNTSGGMVAAFASVWPEGADVVIDATGVPAVALEAVELARDKPWDDDPSKEGARYLFQGSYPADVPVPYRPAFMKELSFYLPRNTQRCDMEAVLSLMAQGGLQVRDVISDVRPPEAAAETFKELRERTPGLMTVAFKWE